MNNPNNTAKNNFEVYDDNAQFENISPTAKLSRYPPYEKQMMMRLPPSLVNEMNELLKKQFIAKETQIDVEFIGKQIFQKKKIKSLKDHFFFQINQKKKN